jgi:hypothetical protein
VQALANHGAVFGALQEWDEAERCFQEAMRLDMALRGEGSAEAVDLKRMLAFLRRSQGRLEDALVLLYECLAMHLKVAGKHDFNILFSYGVLISLLSQLPRPHEMITTVRTAIGLAKKLVGADHEKTREFEEHLAQLRSQVAQEHTCNEACFSCSHRCGFCWVVSDALDKCGGCGKAQYCGVVCQRGDWTEHKVKCGKV